MSEEPITRRGALEVVAVILLVAGVLEAILGLAGPLPEEVLVEMPANLLRAVRVLAGIILIVSAYLVWTLSRWGGYLAVASITILFFIVGSLQALALGLVVILLLAWKWDTLK